MSSIIDRKAGSRCPISGRAMAACTRGSALPGPGPQSRRWGGLSWPTWGGVFTAESVMSAMGLFLDNGIVVAAEPMMGSCLFVFFCCLVVLFWFEGGKSWVWEGGWCVWMR